MSEHHLSRQQHAPQQSKTTAARPATTATQDTHGPGTEYVHAGYRHDQETGAVVPPIHLSTTYAQEEPGVHKGYEYSRSGNPTRSVFEHAIAQVEKGTHGFAFASGLAATDTLLRLLSPDEHTVANRNLYGGTHRLFNMVLARYGLSFTYVDARKTDAILAGMTPKTRMVFLETPTNPNLELVDLETTIRRVREHESEQGTKVIVVVDNTFATPYNQRPLELGADVVLHSVTKYLGGHSDVLGGALVAKDDTIAERIGFHQNAVGGVMDPFSAYMTHRGIKTLHVRMQRHAENAQRVAEYLKDHEKIQQVWYPGLKEHEQYDLAVRQMRTPGGMMSFEVKGGLESGKRFMKNVKVWTLAESLGAVESLVNHPAIMTHAAIPKKEREESGITDGLIRLSVGIEEADDLIADLDQALQKV